MFHFKSGGRIETKFLFWYYLLKLNLFYFKNKRKIKQYTHNKNLVLNETQPKLQKSSFDWNGRKNILFFCFNSLHLDQPTVHIFNLIKLL